MRWPLALLIVAFILTWYVGPSAAVRAQISWLAGQPNVETAFHAEGGSTDAFIALLAFAILTPITLIMVVALLCFMVKAIGGLFSRLHLPEWTSTALVVAAFSCGTYALRDSWLPTTLYVLGLWARAYLVYTSSLPAPPQ